jgi:hypothetical protein
LESSPGLEDVTKLTQQVAQSLFDQKVFRSWYEVNDACIQALRQQNMPSVIVDKLIGMRNKRFSDEADFVAALGKTLDEGSLHAHQSNVVAAAFTRLSPAEALSVKSSASQQLVQGVKELFGASPPTFAGEVLADLLERRADLWRSAVKKINWELFDRGTETFTWYALEELAKVAQKSSLVAGAKHGSETEHFAAAAVQAQLDNKFDQADFAPFVTLRAELEKPFREHVFLWPRTSGP